MIRNKSDEVNVGNGAIRDENNEKCEDNLA